MISWCTFLTSQSDAAQMAMLPQLTEISLSEFQCSQAELCRSEHFNIQYNLSTLLNVHSLGQLLLYKNACEKVNLYL